MEHSVSVKDLKIRYLQKGTGAPVVLFHGYSFSADTWVETGLFDALARDYCVYSFDMPYGIKSRSDKLDTENREHYAEFVHDLMKTLVIHTPSLIGASISGEVTLRYLISGHSAQAAIVIGPAGMNALSGQLGSITTPLLGIWGDQDTISPPSHAELIRELVKNTEVRIIEGAGHACYLDKPGIFMEIVKGFLQRVSA